ncbi:diguanylate cyclase [Lactiplantibacillus plantarum]|nr:diguanylate cyclase [Lactiplantibacillus plantarum]MCG0618188.1 diguanylate cyclase [Lactiplantibacillus plantarum]MCG0806623.1 diguanylate cyclase [Lactiplantibacillus plantarum]MCG0831541.1 diguanylate cyclase [Lactiplantibacillus plantarum]MCG0850339.1 diguanylate cyclase [Lactiplantibacillus plantarum]
MYRFFVQPQVDHSHRAVFGYELLLVDCKINPNAVRTKKISFL